MDEGSGSGDMWRDTGVSLDVVACVLKKGGTLSRTSKGRIQLSVVTVTRGVNFSFVTTTEWELNSILPFFLVKSRIDTILCEISGFTTSGGVMADGPPFRWLGRMGIVTIYA